MKNDQSAEFSDHSTKWDRVSRGAVLNATQIADDAMLLRDIASRVPAREMRWGRSADGTTSSLTIQEGHVSVTDVLTTARALVGSTAVTVDIRPAKPTSPIQCSQRRFR